MKTYIHLIILFFIALQAGYAQSEARLIRDGNKKYLEGDYQQAARNYYKALEENPESVKALFNLGAALYQHDTLNTFESSERIFDTISQIVSDKMQKSSAYHNLGNSLLELKKYQESIKAYKQALRNNPSDFDSKYNLEYAKKMLKQQQQHQQQKQDNKNKDNKDQNQDQKQDQKDEKEKKDQQQQQQQDKEQEKQQQQQKNEENKDQKEQQMPKPQQISKEDAKRLLEALKNDEKKTLEKIMKLKVKAAKGAKTEKDW